jgi:four helix bundle protein
MTPLNREELQKRTKQFGLRVMKLCDALPRSRSANVIANQLLRSATSVGANYRSACRARSSADWINKLGVVIEEADESAYWLELIIDGELLPVAKVAALLKEADELTAIFTASQMTSKRNTAKKS